ncbi:isoleucyl-tRNA synthetase [Aphelenchoides avenae]|nr:isoleucyl-tRNA synthetase [Aphelenchus avenae]
MYEQMFFDWDESIGEVREYTPKEKYERVKQQSAEFHAAKNKPQKKTEKYPKLKDLSFEFSGQSVTFTITEFVDREVLVLSTIGKVGHVVEVLFPKERAVERRAYQRAEYDTKFLLGPDNKDVDLLVRRFATAISKHRGSKTVWLCVGLDPATDPLIRHAVDQLEAYFTESVRTPASTNSAVPTQ